MLVKKNEKKTDVGELKKYYDIYMPSNYVCIIHKILFDIC